MQTKKILLVLGATVFLGVLAGCQAEINAPSTPSATGQSSSTVQVSNAVAGAEQTPSASEADQTAYSGALKLKDPSFCDKIQDSALQKQCKTDVQDRKYSDQALAQSDASVCAQLSTKDKQDACKTAVEISLAQSQQQAERDQQFQTSNQITQSGDYTLCAKELKDPALIESCEFNTLVSKAVSTNDYSWCDKIKNADQRQNCRSLEKVNNQATQQK